MIQFGVQIEPQFGYSPEEVIAIVQSAEKKSFSHAWFSDHFMMTADSTDKVCLDAYAAMMIGAVNTSHLKIGSMVYCNLYRHPAVLAKMMASLDHISKGRVEFGIGAGWKKLEFDAYGMNFPTAGVRIKMLEEGIKVIKKLWKEERTDFQGKYYQLNDAISYPKMLQENPSVWVGTMEAKPKMLKLIGELAEGVNIAWAFSPEIFKERVERIKEARAKTSLPPLKISSGSWVRIVDEDQYEDMIKQRALARKITVEEADKQMQGALVGTREQIYDKIVKYKEIGVTHFVFMFPYGEEEEYLGQFQGLLKKLG